MNATEDPDVFMREGRTYNGSAAGHTILTGGEFIADFKPPDYLVHRILQRRYFYSLTAPTGAGKTAIALRLAAHVELGRSIGGYEVEQGRFLYFAGENPDDVRMRWIAMAEAMEFDPSMGHFIPGVSSIPALRDRVQEEADAMGGFALVIVDTSAAYFEGDQENDNVAMGTHARMLRSLTTLPSGPTVLALCHPVKNATADNLLPRGGGAYVAEVDGNLIGRKADTIVELDWQGKFRGPGFEPIAFELVSLTTDKIMDSKGRQIPTVMARPLTEREHAAKASAARSDQDVLLIAMTENEGASIAGLADKAEWFTATGLPYKSKVQRLLKQLKRDHMVIDRRGSWGLTEAGQKEAKKAQSNATMAGAKYA